MASVPAVESLLDSFRQTASALPDARTGANQRYSIADAASCALATFFFQSLSFLDFQRRMQEESARSNCQSLFGVDAIPCDNAIRNLLAHLYHPYLQVLYDQQVPGSKSGVWYYIW